MNTITAYECDYCGKLNKTAKAIKRHEKICFKNPETKSCVVCQLFNPSVTDEAGEHSRNCVKGLDISKKLKTGCEGFLYRQAD